MRTTIRDPIWNTIVLDDTAVRIVDSPVFQRLRYIKQLGLAHLVYPGATHTRFDHALGVYALAKRAIRALEERGELAGLDPTESRLVPLAGLLHDIGHYPFSHALEELEERRIPGHHESLAGRFLGDAEVQGALESVAPDGPARIEALIRGASPSPLQGLVSGSLDLDKIEYLKRDARFCGVPYGEVDVDRLLYSLTLLEAPDTGRREVGVRQKGVAALESLLFAKYQMYRNVYWHHAVRAATVLYTRAVGDALEAGLIEPEELVGRTDEALLYLLEARAKGVDATAAEAAGVLAKERVAAFVEAIHARRLPKRAAEVVATELERDAVGEWVVQDSSLKRRVEDRLADELGLRPGLVFLDYPAKPAMFQLDLLVRLRDGRCERLGPAGRSGLIGLPGIAGELYHTARVLRLFTLGARRELDGAALTALVRRSAKDVEAALEGGVPLLG
ncbi:MAG: HD domain-containing protein [Gemmatimonadota bacterium]